MTGELNQLYVKRKVIRGHYMIQNWAEHHGIKTIHPSHMHVTVVFSKTPVNKKNFIFDKNYLKIEPYGRYIDSLDPHALVLKIKSDKLKEQWEYYKENGCSWDYEDYHPHITLNYATSVEDAEKFKKIKPFEGEIYLGEEIPTDLDLKWVDKISKE